MRLRRGGKILFLLLLAAIGYFVIKNYLPAAETDNTLEVFDDSAKKAEANAIVATGDKKAGKSNSKPTGRTFNFTPEKPVNGKYKGVVELGAAGFNSFVIDMDKQKRWTIISKDFGESLAYEGLATIDDIRTGLKKYITGMFDKGVSKNDMHFVISAGAQKEPKTLIISDELKKIGYVVNLVTTEKEGRLGYQATVPPPYEDSSFLVDIGSGTTKISWKQGNEIISHEMPGSKYFEKTMSDEAIYKEVRSKASKVPDEKRRVCFIIGGVPFTLAKQNRNGDERYTILDVPGSYTGNDKKTEAGLNIYKAITDATNCKTFVFDWDSNFTIGFLLGLR